MVNGIPLRAEIDGVLRGLLPSGIPVVKGMKAGDIDPRCEVSHCFTVSDKALAVAGGALEAIQRIST
jgi:xanthine dehydrogenase accessory factor